LVAGTGLKLRTKKPIICRVGLLGLGIWAGQRAKALLRQTVLEASFCARSAYAEPATYASLRWLVAG